MKRLTRRLLAACAVVAGCAIGLGGTTAEAGWHWHGSVGGYANSWAGYGSYGSHGASVGYGSHGSWGGGHHGLRHHRRLWHGSHGSHGAYRSYSGWGSSGGSYGGSSGGGSSGGGSSGGYINGGYKAPVDGTMTPAAPAAPAPNVPIQPPPPVNPGALLQQQSGNQAVLKVTVPEDALVYVNGMLTQSTGANRSYVSRGLMRGYQYNYEVRAEAIRDGKKVEETRIVQLTAGETMELAFDGLSAAPATTLTLNVPEEAKITLAGNPTPGEGSVRVFTTTKLSAGSAWSDYVVQVSVERNGRTITQEKTISLQAGDSQTLTFDFDATQVAQAR
jgi:uncharacterized protein (TIGR03000 family)